MQLRKSISLAGTIIILISFLVGMATIPTYQNSLTKYELDKFSLNESRMVEFEDVTQYAGITYHGKSSGVSWGDFNSDSFADVFTPNHGNSPTLYLNNGNGTFAEVSSKVGVNILHGIDSHGVASVDFDNDGDEDLLIQTGSMGGSGIGSNFLFINEDGFFQNKAEELNLEYSLGRGRTPLWVDFDNDGLLDIILTNSPRLDGKAPTALFRQTNNGFEFVTSFAEKILVSSPQIADITGDLKMDLIAMTPNPHGIFQMDSIPFKKITPQNLSKIKSDDFAIGDFDGDLLNDIFFIDRKFEQVQVIFDGNKKIKIHFGNGNHELKFQTTGKVNFKVYPLPLLSTEIFVDNKIIPPRTFNLDLSSKNFTDFDISKHENNSHGFHIDLNKNNQTWSVKQFSPKILETNLEIEAENPITFISNFEPVNYSESKLFLKSSNGFKDVTNLQKFDKKSSCNSVISGDFDNDMDIDLYLVCTAQVENLHNRFYENLGKGTFQELYNVGIEGSTEGIGDSATLVDFNNDGFLDIFIMNGEGLAPFSNDGPYQLFKNKGNNNHWIEIDLVGDISNRDAIGSKVFVTAGNVTQLREQTGGMHSGSQNHKRLHFGLGNNESIEKISIFWPSGITQEIKNIESNKIIEIFESTKNPISPKNQLAFGLQPQNVLCINGLELIMKSLTQSVGCVKPTSKIVLIDRGWGIPP